MKLVKIILSVAITMAITITLTMRGLGESEEKPPFSLLHYENTSKDHQLNNMHETKLVMPQKRANRILEETTNPRNPNAADHCNKDNEVCYVQQSTNSTCCNNKCIDLSTDSHNCGACKNKCKFTQACCRGECVNLSFDKRHCGYCNHRCNPGEYCVYGMCDYA